MGKLLRFSRGHRAKPTNVDNRPFALTLTLRQPEPHHSDGVTPEEFARSKQLLDETMANLARTDEP